MRQIKFRAWDSELNKFYKPTYEAYNGNLFELLIGMGGRLCSHTMAGITDESMFPDRFKLQQFTGLHDRNGKEIYEGDINQHNGVVTWNNDDASFVWEYKDIETMSMEGEVNWCEIIGNIYENPELINK